MIADSKKRNLALQKELALVEKREKKMAQTAMSKKTPQWKAEWEEKIPSKVYSGLESGFSKAFRVVFEQGRGVIEKGYSKADLTADFEIRNYAVQRKGGRKELRQVSKGASRSGFQNLAATTLEGIGLGALGIGMPDLVLFIGTVLKGVYETALSYGFDYESPWEQAFILKMMEQDYNAVYFDGQPEYWSRVEYVDKYKNSAEKYKSMLPDAWQAITQEALDAGHGGMDYVELREFVDRLKDGREMAVDVYDAASWMVITCLSEESIKNGGKVMEIPDFTKGAWKTRPSQDVLAFNEYVEE